MQIMHEEVTFLDEMPINIAIHTLTDSSKHWHNCIEILLVLSGKLSITIDSETFHLFEDDIILINSSQAHEVHSSNNVVAWLQINSSFFSKWIDTRTIFQCNSTLYHNKCKFNELKRIIAKMIYVQYNEKDGNELLTISFSYQLLLKLNKNFRSYEKENESNTSKCLQRLGDITGYLIENYSENITLSQVAEREFLSPSYLSHFFKSHMGITFFSYLTGIRMNHAVHDLLTTDLTIEQIAANNGFANCRYFVTAFKKQFGMPPRQFRIYHKNGDESKHVSYTQLTLQEQHQDYKKCLVLKHHDFLNKLGEYLDADAASEVASNINTKTVQTIEIDTAKLSKTLSHTFKTFTSVGRAKELLIEHIREQLRILQNEVGFQYIKFHGILDDTMMLYSEDHYGNPYLSYHYVDQVIDFLVSINLKPLIQFSFMPKALAKDPTKTIFYNPVILSEPKDYSKWEFLITNLTKHFINRYGLDEVRTWLFSFWNMPFKSYIFSFESNEIAYELYRITRASVKKCDSLLNFGTPSYGSLDFTCKDYIEFLDYCIEKNCFPDFYNIHCYPVKNSTSADQATFGVSLDNTIILSENPDYMKDMIRKFKKNLASFPKLPIYITEWAPTSSHRDWLNDTCYRSAYIVKNILENYDEVDSFGSWCLSDALEELPFDNQFFHGELGLFTNCGIKKPAYYAYIFLKKLMNTLVDNGPGYFVTTNQKGDYVILLYNYIHITPLYAKGVLFNVTYIERYNAFVDPSSMLIDLVVSPLDNGTYTLTEHYVNRQSGSAFDEWVRMGAIPLTCEEEVTTLKGRSMPKINKTSVEVTNKQFNYYGKLEPHEIRLIEINKSWF